MTDFTNPYTNPVWRGWIRGAHHGGAKALQDLALHLDNSRNWKANLGSICGLSDDHWECALAMIFDYRERGESNREFMALCEAVAAERDNQRAHEP
jgi:hypothetical protein